MIVLSTFNSEYLREPLNYLLSKFSEEKAEVIYGNIFINLKKNISSPQAIIILVRLKDFILCQEKTLDEKRLQANIKKLIDQVKLVKSSNSRTVLVTLCPSLEENFSIQERLKKEEKSLVKKLDELAIENISYLDIKNISIDNLSSSVLEQEAHIPYSPEYFVHLAYAIAKKWHFMMKKTPFKVIVVDCDNTLWGGVADEVGIDGVFFKEHHQFLQHFLVEQSRAGMLICLCSKNDEHVVTTIFSQRQAEMALKREHVTVIKANWFRKSDNIRALAEELNLGIDQFIFIDDSEREIIEVKRSLPVLCVKMPENKTDLEKVLESCWAFDRALVTKEDRDRAEFYKKESIFKQQVQRREKLSEFVKSLNLDLVFEYLNRQDKKKQNKHISTTLARVSQLSERTNQFNLYASPQDMVNLHYHLSKENADILIVSASGGYIGDYGIIASALFSWETDTIEVKSFFVSCRAFSLGIEYQLLKNLASFAKDKKIANIKFNFKKTNKNHVAQSFIKNLFISINKDTFSLEKMIEGEESIINFLTRDLLLLDIDQLIDQSNRLKLTDLTQEKLPINEDKLNSPLIKAHYLQSIMDETCDFNLFINRFFSSDLLLSTLEKNKENIVEIVFRILQHKFNSIEEINKATPLICLGLDSIKATELSYYLYKMTGVNFSISELLSQETTVTFLENIIIKRKKLTVSNKKAPEKSIPELASWQQERLWMAEQKEILEKGFAEYQMLACYVIDTLEIEKFKQACQQLIKQHDIFGMIFFTKDHQLRMSISDPKSREFCFKIREVSTESMIKESILAELKEVFLMKNCPLIKFIVYKLNTIEKCKYYLLFLAHHAIFDAISLKNTFDFLSETYQSDHLDSLSVQVPQYSDYIQYQRCKDNSFNEAIDYWTGRLRTIDTVAEFRADKEKNVQQTAENMAKRKTFSSSSATFHAIKKIAQELGTTCYGVMSALYSILISHYSYHDQVVLLTASTGRANTIYYKTIGFFVNLLVQPFTLQENKSLKAYIKENYQQSIQDKKYEEIPFEKIQAILKKNDIQDIFLAPALIYQNYVCPELTLKGEKAQLFFPENPILFDCRSTCHFGPFTLFISESDQEFNFLIEYAKDNFSEILIDKIMVSFLALLDNFISNPNQMLYEISCLDLSQREKITQLGQGSIIKYDQEKSLVHRFKESVLKDPDHIALHFADKQIRYIELDYLSTELAKKLSNNKIQKNDKVGLCLNQKYLFPIALLAIWKRGAICVPLSNEDPDERHENVILDSGLTAIILQENENLNLLINKLKYRNKIKIISLDFDRLKAETQLNPMIFSQECLDQLSARQGSCIYFTSGSTGKPKGVILHQYNILRVVDNPQYLSVCKKDKVVLASDIAFDAAIFEVLIALLNQATLVVLEKETILNKNLFEKALFEQKISLMWLTAGLFHQYALTSPEIFRSLTYLLVGGDVIKKQALERVFFCPEGSPKYILNGYGPTENSTFTTVSVINKETFSKQLPWVPIGRPINNTLTYVLGRFGQLAPLGAVGELVMSGEGLAQGYLNRPDLEKQRFVLYPHLHPSRFYRSGDKVCWSTDEFGREQLCYIERIGEEIKRQGYFISLEGISHCLKEHPAIAQVIILNTTFISGEQALIAFYKRKKDHKIIESIEDYLASRLPSYMLPSFYQEVSEIPLTRNGKVDKNQLLSLALPMNRSIKTDVLHLDAVEKKIYALFRKIILPADSQTYCFDVEKSFFLLGGSSIQAVQIIMEIEMIFSIEMNYSVLREHASVRKLSVWIHKQIDKKEQYEKQEETFYCIRESNIVDVSDVTPIIIFIHPAGGTIDCYRELINHLPQKYACFGIEDPVITKKSQKMSSLTEMASYYLEMIEKNISGHFILSGYSFGGMLSLEMATQAEKKGINTLLGVFLLDTWIVSCAKEEAKQILRERVNAYFTETVRAILKSYPSFIHHDDISMSESQFLPKKEIERLQEQYHFLQDLGFKFTPKKLMKTLVVLFKANTLDDYFKKINYGKGSENNYLSVCINKEYFVIIKTNGDHFSILNENNSFLLAKLFSKELKTIQAKIELNV